jgi:hypothetical protein
MQYLMVYALVDAEAFDRPAHHDGRCQKRTSLEAFPGLDHTIPYSTWDSLMESSLAGGPHLDRGGFALFVLSDQARRVAELALDERQLESSVLVTAVADDLAREVGRRWISAGSADNGQSGPAGSGMGVSIPLSDLAETGGRAHRVQSHDMGNLSGDPS